MEAGRDPGAGAASARAAQKALPAIPIIFSGVADPVAEGLVASQAKPGKNLTGVSQSFEGLEPKLLEVLREMNPGSRKIAVVYDSVTNPVDRTLAHLRAAAATLRFAIEEHDAAGPEGFPKALAAAALTRPDALLPAGRSATPVTTRSSSPSRTGQESRFSTMSSNRRGAEAR